MGKQTELNELYSCLKYIGKVTSSTIALMLDTRRCLRVDGREEADHITDELFYLLNVYFATCNDDKDIATNLEHLTDDIMELMDESGTNVEQKNTMRYLLAEWLEEQIPKSENKDN